MQMVQDCKEMYKNTIERHLNFNPEPPEIKIIQSNFFEGISNWKMRGVTSPFYYLWRNEQPGAEVECNGIRYKLDPEQIFLIPPNTLFSTFGAPTPFNQFYVHFFLSGKHFRRGVHALPAASGRAKEFFQRLREAVKNPESWCLFFYGVLYTELSAVPNKLLRSGKNEELPERIREALEIMNRPVVPPLGNGEIAERLNISKNHFMREFKRAMHISPQQYLLRHRIDRCRDDLVLSDMTIDEIAASGGFTDRYHFSKVFRKLTGSSPAEYRHTLRKISAVK